MSSSSEKLIQIAENQRKVYDTGHADGYSDGHTEGYENGYDIGHEEGIIQRNEEIQTLNSELETTLNGGDTGYKSYYHEFWDAYQVNGTRTNYLYAFGNTGWNDITFKPKYDIVPSANGAYTFYDAKFTNFKKSLQECGVVLDTSTSVDIQHFFRGAWANTHVPTLSCLSATNLTGVFYGNSRLVTIDKLILRSDGANTFNATFSSCSALENITIEGVIGQNGFNVQWSTKLSKASITSIINALSATTSGLTVTLSKTAVNNAFTTDEWNTLIATKSNWTISLV